MQLIAFPPLGSVPHETWAAAAAALAAIAPSGDDANALRGRLLAAKSIELPAVPRWLAMFGVTVQGSRAHLDASAREALASPPGPPLALRLWQVNELLAATVHRLLAQRPHSRDEIYKHLASAAYLGDVPSHPELVHWLAWAALVGVIRPLGVALAAGPAAALWEPLAKGFDVATFLAAHPHGSSATAVEPVGEDGGGVVAPGIDASTAAVARSFPALPAQAAGGHPLRGVPPAVLLIAEPSPLAPATRAEALAELPPSALAAVPALVARANPTARLLHARDAELAPSIWQEDPSRALLQLGLLAALAFRADSSGRSRDRTSALALYRAIIDARLLDALVEGQLPASVPAEVDAASLLLASVLARRLADAPMLPDQLASAGGLRDVMVALDNAIGRGLLGIELFWVARALGQLGVLRYPGLALGPAIPWRAARDALARWGALPTPYAADMEALIKASLALGSFATADLPGDAVVIAFEAIGGCAAWTQPAYAAAFGCCGKAACLPFCLEQNDMA